MSVDDADHVGYLFFSETEKNDKKEKIYEQAGLQPFFLPLNEYIPDGEPHVWGDRVYHYGSHDKEGGYHRSVCRIMVYLRR